MRLTTLYSFNLIQNFLKRNRHWYFLWIWLLCLYVQVGVEVTLSVFVFKKERMRECVHKFPPESFRIKKINPSASEILFLANPHFCFFFLISSESYSLSSSSSLNNINSKVSKPQGLETLLSFSPLRFFFLKRFNQGKNLYNFFLEFQSLK